MLATTSGTMAAQHAQWWDAMAMYQAFISYKHHAGLPVAERLAKGLRAYARPLFKAPPRIFRDEDHLVPGNSLPRLIQQALRDSEFLILLASPEAAASPWVQDELRIWCEELQRKDRLIFVLVKGEIAVDARTKRLQWAQTDALPALLGGILEDVPLFIDLRAIEQAEKLDLAVPEFKKAVNTITARLRGIAPDDLAGEEARVFRRNLRIRNAAVLIFGALALLSTFLFWQTRQALQRAENENAQVRASLIATRAEQIRTQDPQAAALIAAESVQRLLDRGLEPATATLQTLLRTLETIGGFGLRGHTERVTAVAISPDSRWLAAGDAAGEVLVWESRDPGRVAYRLKGNEDEIQHLEFDRDSKRLVSTGLNDARVWNLATPAVPPIVLGGHADFVYGASFDERSHVVTASGTGVRIWDLSKAAPTPQKATGVESVMDARFALGGDLVVFCGDGVWMWRWKDGNTAPRQLSPKTSFHMALSRDGRHLAAGFNDGSLLVWDLSAGTTPVHSWRHGGSVEAVAFDESGTRLASASNDQTARIWDLTEENAPLNLDARFNIEQVSFSAKGDALVTIGGDVILLWSTYWLYTPAPIRLRGHEGSGSVSELALSGDGRFMLTAGYEAIPRLWDLQRLDPRVTVLEKPGDEAFESLAIARRARRIAATSRYEVPAVWDLDDLAAGPMSLQRVQKNDFQAALSEDGCWLATAGVGMPSFLWDLRHRDQAPRKLSAHTSFANKVAFTPDSSWIAMLDEGGSIVLEETAVARPRVRLSSGRSSVADFEIDPSAPRLVSVHNDGMAFLWPLPDGKPRQLSAKGPSLRRVKISPRGRFAAAVGEGPDVRLWTLPGARALSLPLPAGASATRLSFDEEEGFLAVGTAQGQVLLYELDGNGEPHVLRSHTEEIVGLAFDPSGKWLASATLLDGIRLWNPLQTAQSPIQLTTKDLRTASPGTSDSSPGVMQDIAFVGPGVLAAATGKGTIHLWKVDPQGWVDAARKAAGRSLTREEAVRYLEQDGSSN